MKTRVWPDGTRQDADEEPYNWMSDDFYIEEIMETPYKARKVGGNYQAEGTVVSEFYTLAGRKRLVFEFDNPSGMLHIFTPEQVEAVDESKTESKQ